MQLMKAGDKWLIHSETWDTIDASGIGGGRGRDASRVREVFHVWTGGDWKLGQANAHLFESQEAAQAYLDQHADQRRALWDATPKRY